MQNNIFYIALFFLLMACNSNATNETIKQTETQTEENVVVVDSIQKANAGILTGKPEIRTIHSSIKLNGIVDVPPQSLVSISFPLSGYLKTTPLLPGYHVHKGMVIATLEDPSFVQMQQDYLTAKARMEYLSTDVQRQKELSDADATSKKNYQLVLSDYKAQEVLVKSLEEKLRIININPATLTVEKISRTVPVYSPIDGYVSKVNVNIGKYVSSADVLFELVNPDDIHAAMTVFEKDISYFKKGMQGKVTLTDHPSEQYSVDVILVSKNVDENRSSLVHCHFDNPDHQLLPGMFLTGSFDISNITATVVPQEAVVRYMGKGYIFTTNDAAHFAMTEVQTGASENGYIQLKDADSTIIQQNVAVKGAYALLGKLKNKMEEE
ncbi:MAG: efflux RND transporter periplasmic adaptor subunit [Ilyomonas sp.]